MKKHLKKSAFSLKLCLTNLCIVGLVLLVTFSIFVYTYIDISMKNIKTTLDHDLNTLKTFITEEIHTLETVTLQISNNAYVSLTMNHAAGLDDFFENDSKSRNDFYDVLLPFILERDKVNRISVYNDYGEFIYAGDALETKECKPYKEHNYISPEFKKQENKLSFLYCTNDKISIVRKIKTNPTVGKNTIAYVEAELSLDIWKKALLNNYNGEVSYVIYQPSTGMVLVKSDSLAEYCISNISELPDDFYEEYYVDSDVSGTYDIGYYTAISKENQKDFVSYLVLTAFLVCILIMVFITIIQVKLTKRLTLPLVRLCDTVRHTNIDEGMNEACASETDEFSLISYSFQRMLKSLKQSMELNVEIKTAEIKAQMFAVQAQMNPHFIHNTIAIIQAYSQAGESDTVNAICGHLSDMIRYSNEYTDTKVWLSQEIDHVKNYMELIKIRYEDGIIFELENKIPANTIKVPRFILQPLVENSITHGLKQKEFPWYIRISCETTESYWMVRVQDNGIGLSKEKREELEALKNRLFEGNTRIISENLKIGGLGLKNTIIRLYLEYGRSMIFETGTNKEGGCIIVIGGTISKI